ncbi:MAG: protein kinase [Deltaproteobacteria bacterium]|nr:protein kinase [Deltaproteobacteria bacterium]
MLRTAQAAGTIEQRYSLGRCLGQGSFGVVYQAFDVDRGVDVALKRLSRLDASAVYRFKQEFRALADLRHPNLVKLYELFAVEGEFYLVMELVDGVPLLSWVRSEGRLEEEHLRSSLRQIASAVQSLHHAGKLHRDLKPANVLVRPSDGHATVLDFGLVATLEPSGDHLSIDQAIVGTPAYMAPEGASGEPITRASDWYAFGVLVFEALTGRLPFDGTPLQVLSDKLDKDAPDVRALAPDAPADLAQLCAELLVRDPRARPSGPDVLARLSSGGGVDERPAAVEARAPAVFALVGRERHRRTLDRALAATRTGRAVTVLVSGEPGAGKTALVSAFLDAQSAARGHAAASDAVVLRGRCYERESVPYNALDSAIDALARHLATLPLREARALVPREVHALAKLFPVLLRVEAVHELPDRSGPPPEASELRRRAFGALRDLVGRLADRRPVIIALDDLQWGDGDSATLLLELLRPPDPPAVMLIASFRPEDAERSELLRELLSARARGELGLDVIDLEVGALSREEAEKLAAELLGAGDPGTLDGAQAETRARVAADIARESEGSPLFVHELVRYLRDTPDAAASGPLSLADVLSRRIAALPGKTGRLLEIIAVAGTPVALGVAMLAANIDPTAEHEIVAALRDAHLVRIRGVREHDELEIAHARIGELLVARLGASGRADRHHRLARALESVPGADPEALFAHFEAAGDVARARPYAERAADRAAAALAFDRAAALYQSAYAHGPRRAEDAKLAVKLADALEHAGRGEAAARAYSEAASVAREPEARGLRIKATEQYLRCGRVDEGLAQAEPLLTELGLGLAKTPSEAATSLLFRRAQLRLRGVELRKRQATAADPALLEKIDAAWAIGGPLSSMDLLRGTALLTRQLLLALDAGEPFRVARALATDATFTALTGLDLARSQEVAAKARALAESIQNPLAVAYAAAAEAIVALCGFRWRDAYRLSDEALARFEEVPGHRTWERGSIEYCSLRALVALGRLGELSQRAPSIVAQAVARGDLYTQTMVRTFVLVWRWLAEDRPDEGARDADDAIAAWSHRDFFLQHAQHGFTRSMLALYKGDHVDAGRRLERLWPDLERTYLLRNPNVRFTAWALRGCIAIASGSGSDAARVVEKAASVLEKDGFDHTIGCAWVLRAGWSARNGRPAEALRALAEADRRFESSDSALFGAAVRRRRGELLGGDDGRALRDQADAWLRAQGVRRPEALARMMVPGF